MLNFGYFDSKILKSKSKLQINVIKKMIPGRTPGGSNKILGRLGNINSASLDSKTDKTDKADDLDPTIWGSVTWKILHNLFKLYDDLLAKTTTSVAGVASASSAANAALDRQDLLNIVAQLGEPHGLPCTTCTRNFKEYFESHPKPSATLTFSDWSFQHHNHVNKLLGKAGFVSASLGMPLAGPASAAVPRPPVVSAIPVIRPPVPPASSVVPPGIKVTINNVQKFYYSQPQSRQLKLMTNASHIRHCKKVQEIVNNRMQQWLVQRKAASSNVNVIGAAAPATAVIRGNNNKAGRPPIKRKGGGCGCRR